MSASVQTDRARRAGRTEWPTWALIAAVYGGWLGAVGVASAWGPLVGSGVLALACCWFMSLQHELLHGHPTRSQRINRCRVVFGPALVILPTWLNAVRQPLRGDFTHLRCWLQHAAMLAVLLFVINEAGWLWRWLFLNNNYHAVHHAQPSLPWWRIRGQYLAQRDEVLVRNGQFLVPGYGTLMRRHALVPVDSPVHRSGT